MITVTIRLQGRPEKMRELRQALAGLAQTLTGDRGCLGHHLGQDIEQPDLLFFWQAWASGPDVERYWCSDQFSALLGMEHLLARPLELQTQRVTAITGLPEVHQVRRGCFSNSTRKGG